MEAKRVLRGAKKLVAVFSAGTMILPLTGCRAQNRFDAKSIEKALEQYNLEFGNGAVKNGIEMYEYVRDLFSSYKKYASKTIVPIHEPQNEYYVGPIEQKEAITIKTNTTPIIITVDSEDSYYVYTSDKNEEKKSVYTYNIDGSYSIFEDNTNGTTKVQFDKDGLIESLEKNEKQENYSLYKYEDGNMDTYSLYAQNGDIQMTMNEDGSYTEFKYHGSYEEYIDKKYERLGYNYDREGVLKSIDAYRTDIYENGIYSYRSLEDHHSKAEEMPHKENIHAIYEPNGDSYTYVTYYDMAGNYLGEKKVREKYQEYRDTVQSTVVDGKTSTIVSRFDYNVADPEWSYDDFSNNSPVMGTFVYEKVDDTITVKMKDGIIYKYTAKNDTIRENRARGGGIGYSENCPAGCFRGAYKVVENGVMHYNEDGSPYYLENNSENKLMYYDENGEAEYTRIEDNNHKDGFVVTEYYGDEKSIVSGIHNYSKDEVFVTANGQDFFLGKGGYVTFFVNGQIEMYDNTSNKDIEVSVENTEYEVKAHDKIKFHENGQLKSIENDKMYRSYYENGNVSSIHNYQKDKEISELGYNLKEGSYVKYNSKGQLEEYFYDKDYNIKNRYGTVAINNNVVMDGDLCESTVIKNGLETVTSYMGHSYFDENGELIHTNKTKVKNIKLGSEVNIKGYDLKYGSTIEYDDNDEHLIYVYDERYTVRTERWKKISTIEENGKMRTDIYQGNGVVSTTEYEKPIRGKNSGYGGRYGVSGLVYTVEIHYNNDKNIQSIISYELQKDDGFSFDVSDSNGNVYKIERGSSIYFNSDGTVESYKNGKDNKDHMEKDDR